MKALIIGSGGQPGRALAGTVPADWTVVGFDRNALDITDGAKVPALVADGAPDIVFNAAAYTAVDRAESNAQSAHALNAEGVLSLAKAADAAQEESLALGLLTREIPVDPIATSDYPTPAPRSDYSVVDVRGKAQLLGSAPPHWRKSLRVMLKELKSNV